MASKRSLPATALFIITLTLLLFTLASSSRTTSSGHGTPPKSSINTPRPSSNGTNTPSGQSGSCTIDALKLGVCVDLLGNLLNITVGQPPIQPCCSLIDGLVDLEAAVCLCIAIRANILGIINLNIPLSLSLLLNVCSRNLPPGFQCN